MSTFLRTPAAFGLLLATFLPAQWDPNNAQWLKSDGSDVRVMTWNVASYVCSQCPKIEGSTRWEAIARIIASMQPDILLLQEAGDSDTLQNLTTVLSLLMYGGNDPFLGGSVTAYVQKYAPGYDLPHVYVSSFSDGFNRNAILSRFPFADLNGDSKATIPDIPSVAFSGNIAYAAGGNGGIRGFCFAELDLPDGTYAGDLVVGNAHLKSGGSSSDIDQRKRAAQNVAYVIDYWYQGGGLGLGPDPNGVIFDSPPATTVLDANTPVVIGGDWNEDETKRTARGPAAWLTEAEFQGGTDGTDRNRSDMTYDSATEFFSGSRVTQSSSKLDHIAWQDSLVASRREFVFYSFSVPQSPSAMPPETLGFSSPQSISGFASDHRPVIVDLMPPLATGEICQEDLGFQTGSVSTMLCGEGLAAGQMSDWDLTGALPGAGGAILFSADNNFNYVVFPFSGNAGTIYSGFGLLLSAPIVADGNGNVSVPFPGTSVVADLIVQALVADTRVSPHNIAFTNAIRASFGQ